MKLILNVTTSYEGKPLKPGNEIDIPLNVAERWINKGIAHPVKEEVKPIMKPKIKFEVKTYKPKKKSKKNK